MDFKLLSDQQTVDIHRQKLLDIEAEYTRLELDVRLAEAAGVENAQVEQARTYLKVLGIQHAHLLSMLLPPPEVEEVEEPELKVKPVNNSQKKLART